MIDRTRQITFALMAAVLALAGSCQPAQAAGILWSVDWSPDNKLYAVGGEDIRLFDANTHEWHPSPALASVKSVRKVRWHPHRNLLAVSSSDANSTAIYDVTTGQKKPLLTKEGTRGIAWSPTGERLATAGNDGSLQIWGADGTLQHTTRQEKAKSLTGVAWHPTDDRIVAIGEFITLYNAAGEILKQVRHRPGAKGFCLLLCVEWHPSGEFFVVGDYGNHDTGDLPLLQFWSADGNLLKTITATDPAPFRNVSWNRDGTLLASASESLRIWSKRGELQHVGKSPDHLWGIHWNRDGDRIITSSMEGRVTLWNASAEILRKVVETER